MLLSLYLCALVCIQWRRLSKCYLSIFSARFEPLQLLPSVAVRWPEVVIVVKWTGEFLVVVVVATWRPATPASLIRRVWDALLLSSNHLQQTARESSHARRRQCGLARALVVLLT